MAGHRRRQSARCSEYSGCLTYSIAASDYKKLKILNLYIINSKNLIKKLQKESILGMLKGGEEEFREKKSRRRTCTYWVCFLS